MTVSRSWPGARPLAEHVRRFSAISGLQAEHCIVYALYRVPGGLEVSVRRTGGPAPWHACCALAVEEERAAGFLLFLYENAVAPEHLQAVIQDMGEALAGP